MRARYRDVDSIGADAGFGLAFLVHVAQYLGDAALEATFRRVLTALRAGGRLLGATIIDDPGTPGFTPEWISAIERFNRITVDFPPVT